MTTNSWMPIPGWEGFYEVSEEGLIRSVERYTDHPISGLRRVRSRVLKQNLSGRSEDARLAVALCRDGKARTVRVHLCVALAFLGPRPDGMECAHLDGDRLNNKVSNLRWVTHAENESHKSRHGTVPAGSRHGNSKLTEEQVLEIRRRCAAGERYEDVAVDYGVTSSNVWCIVVRKTWRHV